MKFTEKIGSRHSSERKAQVFFTATEEEKEEIWNTASYGGKRNALITAALMLLEFVGNEELTEIEKLDLPCTEDDREVFDKIFDTGTLYVSYDKEWRIQEDGLHRVYFTVIVMVGALTNNGKGSSYVLFELRSHTLNETKYSLVPNQQSVLKPHRLKPSAFDGFDIDNFKDKKIDLVLETVTRKKST